MLFIGDPIRIYDSLRSHALGRLIAFACRRGPTVIRIRLAITTKNIARLATFFAVTPSGFEPEIFRMKT